MNRLFGQTRNPMRSQPLRCCVGQTRGVPECYRPMGVLQAERAHRRLHASYFAPAAQTRPAKQEHRETGARALPPKARRNAERPPVDWQRADNIARVLAVTLVAGTLIFLALSAVLYRLGL